MASPSPDPARPFTAPASLRTGVVGVGYFGKFHAQKYARLPTSDLIMVADRDAEQAERIAAEHGCRAVTDYREMIGQVDAVSIVVPTVHHFDVVRDFLDAGIHVLVEKPITDNLEQADALIALARERGVILQVGQLERFSAAADLARSGIIDSPLYIEANRIAPFQVRATDTNVILDLMIHDIDLILTLVDSPVVQVDAVGAPVISSSEDIANTRVRFANGCIASITASRVSTKTERLIRVFQRDSYVIIDSHNKRSVVMRKGGTPPLPGLPPITIDQRDFNEGDKLEREIAAFLDSILTGSPPAVSGEDGRRALEAALRIQESLRAHFDFIQQRFAKEDSAAAQAQDRGEA